MCGLFGPWPIYLWPFQFVALSVMWPIWFVAYLTRYLIMDHLYLFDWSLRHSQSVSDCGSRQLNCFQNHANDSCQTQLLKCH